MTSIAHVAVVVPVADEQDTVVGCLAAIARACERLVELRPELTTDVLVVLDGCRDRTAEYVAQLPVHIVTSEFRQVGAARELGSRIALARAPVAPGRVWTAHTDADSTVPLHWLVEHLRHAELGNTVVLGTVVPSLGEPALSRWRVRHNDEDGHQHVHGANVGVRGDVLDRLGGWAHVESGEDVELVARAAAAGERIARVGGMAVTTSARAEGRAPQGFAGYLRRHDFATDCVEPAAGDHC